MLHSLVWARTLCGRQVTQRCGGPVVPVVQREKLEPLLGQISKAVQEIKQIGGILWAKF